MQSRTKAVQAVPAAHQALADPLSPTQVVVVAAQLLDMVALEALEVAVAAAMVASILVTAALAQLILAAAAAVVAAILPHQAAMADLES